ncbi:hypothetical protein QLS71_008970 [Mariniflexile litorale]|uniref:Glycosyl hydrolases family 43 n=1 Tax=Mariniflexile litorale TaxID=3045158 RepID=A0AAU7EL45_9FLAO|nr:hypothetical protein [Mariniflexile sp. KMM 9835]MDQ8210656.1 hypothetical protein [Mariniflexile sp. KMM 9835]
MHKIFTDSNKIAKTFSLYLMIFVATTSTCFAQSLYVVSDHQKPVVNYNHPDVLATKNLSGFETGQVVKLNGTYHMFVNEMFIRAHRDMRIAYWTSKDAINWERKGTIKESIPGRSHSNPLSEVWATGVEFNEEENAWNLFYVAYRGGDEEKGELPGSDYSGKIWRAKSVILGEEGIAGPYADMEVIMQPDENSQEWEGQQAVATFNPYKVGNTWFAFYDGHNYSPLGPWPSGLAFSNKLNGPWHRMPEGINPLKIVDNFMENPQVTKMKDGRYLTVFDSKGDHEIGYSISEDGVNWSKEIRLKVQKKPNIWVEEGDHSMRTPLCVIEEDNGSFTIVYTARTKINETSFYAIGKCSLAWK